MRFLGSWSLLTLLQLSVSFNQHYFLRKDFRKYSKPHQTRTESLAKLLRTVAHDYFSDCTLDVIYDSAYESTYPIDFTLYFKDINLPIVQETVDFSSGGKPRERIVEKCTNYFVFLYKIQAMKHIMAQDTKSKIVIISAETPWEVKDFLKSPTSKNYLNLLIVAHSSSRRTGVSF